MFRFQEECRVGVWQMPLERLSGYMAISHRRFYHLVSAVAAMYQEEASQRRLRQRCAMRRAICRISIRRVTRSMQSQKHRPPFSLTCHAGTAIGMEVAAGGRIIPVAFKNFPDHAGVRQV